MTFDLRKTKSGDFEFTLEADGEVLLTSEVYHRRANAEAALASVRKNSTDESRYDRRMNLREKDCFVLKAANHEIIGVSEAFESKAAMETAIRTVMRGAAMAELEGVPE